MFQDLRKRAKDPAASPEQTPTAKPETKEQPKTGAPPTAPAATAPGEDDEPPAPPTGEPATPPAATDKKISPWKLVDQYKAKVGELEKQLVDRKGMTEAEKAEVQKRIDAIELRNKELEDEIRFVNYSKSSEFKEKYEEPYKRAWQSAMAELGELHVTDSSGQSRQVTTEDILQLVTLPLDKAREVADEVFGKFADDVMAHRKEIKRLWEAQSTALQDAKKNGAEREKEFSERVQRSAKEIRDTVTTKWTEANEAFLKDEKFGKFFTPREGDANGNERLQKGFALVDKAWHENPSDPKLTPEEREAVVKRHAAVRHRAAAFGRLVYDLEQANSRISELQKELEDIKKSVPNPASETPPNSGSAGSAKDQVYGALRKIAK